MFRFTQLWGLPFLAVSFSVGAQLLANPSIEALGLSDLAQAPAAAKQKAVVELEAPKVLEKRLKKAYAEAKESTVSVYLGGSASGVVISKKGLVMTAGHVLMNAKPDQLATIKFDDGREFKAKVLGYDLMIDFGLMQIQDMPEGGLPYCKSANTFPATGSPCFVLAHPSGRLKGRPAQLRFGRIKNVSTYQDLPYIAMSDCDIQPGDSGGPLFDLDGQLIGVASSAAGQKMFNRFIAIDQLRANLKQLKTPGSKQGDFDKGPGGIGEFAHKFGNDDYPKLQKELTRRIKGGHQETDRFVKAKISPEGELKITQQELIDLMMIDSVSIVKDRPVSYGLDDPELIKQLPELKTSEITFPIFVGGNQVGFGVRISKDALLVKSSLIPEGHEKVLIGGKDGTRTESQLGKRIPDWDLAVVKIAPETPGSTLDLNQINENPVAGDLLIAIDQFGHKVLGNATDTIRPVTKERSKGPIGEKIEVSKHRSPYPNVIRHAVPLYAADTILPVYNLNGRLVGLHIARFSRTMGLLIPAAELKKIIATLP